jgi:hypothetical protein
MTPISGASNSPSPATFEMASIVSGAACHHLVSARVCVTGDPGYVPSSGAQVSRAVADLELRLLVRDQAVVLQMQRFFLSTTAAATRVPSYAVAWMPVREDPGAPYGIRHRRVYVFRSSCSAVARYTSWRGLGNSA